MDDHVQAVEGCRLPPELDDLALIAAIDGEAEDEVLVHMRGCPHCTARAEHFAELQGVLRKQFFRMFCPTSETLAAYYQGMLPGEQHETIAAHIAECPYCSREMQLLKRLTNDGQVGRAPPGMQNLMNAVANGCEHGSAGPVKGRLRRVFAELLPPAIALSPAYGALRGAAPTRQYAYQAENLQITIGVQKVAHRIDRRTLIGMIEIDDLSAGLDQATASLIGRDQPITTVLDELGNFVLDNIDPGTYSLSLRLPDREVIIEALTL